MPRKKKDEPVIEEPAIEPVVEDPEDVEVETVEEPDTEFLAERVEEPVVEESASEPLFTPPSPVDSGLMYVESHPILGVTRTAHITKNSVGDGRLGDGATIERTNA